MAGTASKRDAHGGPGGPIADGGVGYSCLAEILTVETILKGAPAMPFLHYGTVVRIWMEDDAGTPLFGTIEQVVTSTKQAEPR